MDEIVIGTVTTVAGIFLAKPLTHLWEMQKWRNKLRTTEMYLHEATECYESLSRLKNIQSRQRRHYRTNLGMENLEERCKSKYSFLVSYKEEIETLIDVADAHQSYPSQKFLDREVDFTFHLDANNVSRYESHISRTSNLRAELENAAAFYRKKYQDLYHSNRVSRFAGDLMRKMFNQ